MKNDQYGRIEEIELNWKYVVEIEMHMIEMIIVVVKMMMEEEEEE